MKRITFFCAFLLLVMAGMATPVFAEGNIEPGYEVKFNLHLDAFSDTEEMLHTFQAGHNEDLKVYYFDTPEQTFRAHNYIHRLRVYAGDKKTNITYKKVFPGMSTAEAIEEAYSKGFHGDMSNYKFENDRKEGIDTFSISRKEKFNKNDQLNFDSIDSNYAVNLFKNEAPKKYAEWDNAEWYQATLNDAIQYGPAFVQTYEGSFLEIDADLEIWSYKGETLVEISTKTPEKEVADQIEAAWFEKLTKSGWLSSEQVSKTSFVMDL